MRLVKLKRTNQAPSGNPVYTVVLTGVSFVAMCYLEDQVCKIVDAFLSNSTLLKSAIAIIVCGTIIYITRSITRRIQR